MDHALPWEIPPARAGFVPSGLLRPEHVLLDEAPESLAALFARVGALVQSPRGPRADQVARRLLGRHERASTALARGIALPHAAVGSLARPLAAFVRCRQALDCGAADGRPCRDFLFLLVPWPGTAAHLGLLESLRQRLLAPGLEQRLAACRSLPALRGLLAELLPP
jgi:mannitol/fructose-specific phosphotransferase system IIA component (Ntr-type)